MLIVTCSKKTTETQPGSDLENITRLVRQEEPVGSPYIVDSSSYFDFSQAISGTLSSSVVFDSVRRRVEFRARNTSITVKAFDTLDGQPVLLSNRVAIIHLNDTLQGSLTFYQSGQTPVSRNFVPMAFLSAYSRTIKAQGTNLPYDGWQLDSLAIFKIRGNALQIAPLYQVAVKANNGSRLDTTYDPPSFPQPKLVRVNKLSYISAGDSVTITAVTNNSSMVVYAHLPLPSGPVRKKLALNLDSLSHTGYFKIPPSTPSSAKVRWLAVEVFHQDIFSDPTADHRYSLWGIPILIK